MRRKILVLLTVLLLILLTAASVLSDVRYNGMVERTFEGIAGNAGYVIQGFMYFSLKTETHVYEIQMGPKDFVDRSGFRLKAGEPVTVIGMRAVVEGQAMVLAREIRSGNRVFVARDLNGEPKWDPNRPIQMDPEFPDTFVCYNPSPTD